MTKREEKENFTSKRLRVEACLTKDTQSLSGTKKMQKLLFTSFTFLPYFEAIMNWNSKQETEKQKKTHKYQRLTLVSIRREVKPSSPQNCYGEER